MAKVKHATEYVETRIRGNAAGEFEVVGLTVEGDEEVVSTHETVDEAIKARP